MNSILLARSAEAIEKTKLVYLGAAFALVWIGISLYLFSITRRQRRLEEKITKLQAERARDLPL
ncbi:MAG: CcmD family protein [Actinomycetota bacterium]